jgi:mono/diheme cytochrome c family protein
MKRSAGLAIMAVVPLLMAAMWMDRQPSIKPYQAPVLMPPSGSVPVSGRELVSQDAELKNPVSPNAESVAQGKALFAINCAMCHGQTSAERRPGRQKTRPPASRP